MINRSRTEIVSAMLEAAKGGTTKTRIMFVAFLSYAQLKEYLSMLMESGLIEHMPTERTFRTTKKGLEFIKTASEISRMTDPMVKVKV